MAESNIVRGIGRTEKETSKLVFTIRAELRLLELM